MKKIYLALIVALLCSLSAIAGDTVYVQGYVFDVTGAPAPNAQVKIAACDTINIYTDNNGFYSDTVYCNSAIDSVTVMTWSCQSGWLVNTKAVPPSKTVVASFYFAVCVNPGNACNADFWTNMSQQSVAFVSLSGAGTGDSIVNYTWNFGDGMTISGPPAVTHSYSAPGTYTVMLTIQTAQNCTDSILKVIMITPGSGGSCTASFTDSLSGSTLFLNSEASFTNINNDSIVQRLWKFGNGHSISSNDEATNYTYPMGGVFNVCLQITTAAGCIDSVCKVITIPTGTCNADFTYSTQGFVVSFTSTSTGSSPVTQYAWTFDGPVLGGSSSQNPVYQYPGPGTYQATLNIQTAAGCTDQITKTITLAGSVDTTCVADFNYSINGNTVHFANQSSTQDTAAVTYQWYFGNGAGSTAANPVHNYTANGTYIVKLTMFTASGCVDSTSAVIVINNQSPCHAQFADSMVAGNKFIFISSSTAGANDQIIQRIWKFGDGTGNTGNNPVVDHIYQQSGTYNVCLKIITANGCVDSTCKTITVTIPTQGCVSDFNFQQVSFVQPYTVSFNSSASAGTTTDSIVSRFWTFGDGNQLSGNVVSPFHNYSVEGTYQVCLKITTSSGCQKTVCKTVIVNKNCSANFNYTIGAGGSVSFNNTSSGAGGIADYYWNFGNLGNSYSTNPSFTFPSGTYNVCLYMTDVIGLCTDSICKTITVIAPPVDSCVANFSYNISAGGAVHFTNTSSTMGTNAQYFWNFGNLGTSTAINPVYTFPAGSYYVWLGVTTPSGCTDSIGKMIHIGPPSTNCEAIFQYTGIPPAPGTNGYKFQFASSGSHGATTLDSIISRTWIWGDGSVTGGNILSPQHTYTAAGVYNVCLVILTSTGCSDTICKTVTAPMQNQLSCQSKFTYEHLPQSTNAAKVIKFNSSTSTVLPGDSIVGRKWTFGDGTTLQNGNVISPVHVYQQPGTYNVCLTITTALGCIRTECKLIVVPQSSGNCVPHFTWTKTGPKQIAFNSASSWVPVNDSIIERKWLFGDASPLVSGNVVSPVHNYQNNGIYTVLLKIKTANQCEKTYYSTVIVQDSVMNPPIADRIKIISLYPTSATYQIQAVVWSLQNNIQAEIAVYDIYGTKKWSTNKVLLSGNNVTVIPTGFLATGPYYLRVTTMFGVKSRAFFKQ